MTSRPTGHLVKRGRWFHADIRETSRSPERRHALGTTDRRIAAQELARRLLEIEKRNAGLLPPRSVAEAAQRPLLDLVEVFLAHLHSRQKSANTIRIYRWALRKLSTECSWNYLGDVSAESFEVWRDGSPLSGETKNDFLSAGSRLFRWLKWQKMARENPFEFVEPVDTRASEKEHRRALTVPEVVALLAATPHPRSLVYRMALETGLRRSELLGLRWGDLMLGGLGAQPPVRPPLAAVELEAAACAPTAGHSLWSGPSERHPPAKPALNSNAGPSVRVRASIAKNRKTVLLPLRDELAALLVQHRATDAASFQPVFDSVPEVETLARDLNRAGIPFVDELGRRADFHALRYTFGTHLVLSGAQPRVVMELMRHSDLKLTMKLYTDSRQLQGPGADAVARLPWGNPLLAQAQ